MLIKYLLTISIIFIYFDEIAFNEVAFNGIVFKKKISPYNGIFYNDVLRLKLLNIHLAS